MYKSICLLVVNNLYFILVNKLTIQQFNLIYELLSSESQSIYFLLQKMAFQRLEISIVLGGLYGSGRTPYTLVYRFLILALLTRPLDIIISSGRVKSGRGKNYPAPKIF